MGVAMNTSSRFIIRPNQIGLPIVMILLLYMMFSTFENAFGISLPIVDYSISSYIPMLVLIVCVPLFFSRYGMICESKCTTIILFFCLYLLLRITFSSKNGLSIITILTQSFAWAVFLFIPIVTRKIEEKPFRFIVLCAIFGIVLGTIVYYSNIGGVSRRSLWLAMATNSVFYILALVPYILCSKNKYLRFILLVMSVLIILYSNKATALVGILLVIFSWYYYSNPGGNKNKIFMFAFGSVLIVVLYIIFREPLGNIGAIRKLTTIEENGATNRFPLYIATWNRFISGSVFDKLFGFGFNGSANILNESAHSDFLEILFDYGIIGLLLFLAVLIYLFKEYKKLTAIESPLALPYLSSLMIFVTLTLSSNNIFTPRYNLFISFFWGICFSCEKKYVTCTYQSVNGEMRNSNN